ncbi:MAG: DnaJ domain-containing protein [Thermodesulfobacteriota bacterium]|nr:DnaJ domain-containing protein [Thermodesulfobacteriota bacterium]
MNQDSYVDYYEDLQVSPNADLETIERVYRLLAKRYHPDNSFTGNSERFRIITSAYKVISDAEKRAAFDAKYEDALTKKLKILSNVSSTEGLGNDQQIRHAILSILYIDRRQNPSDSGVGSYRLEKLLKWPEKILEFHIWYLKEKCWIQRVETGGYAITANGVEVVEEDGYILGKERLLTYQ